MKTDNTYREIIQQQKIWAEQYVERYKQSGKNAGYVYDLKSNLFTELSKQTENEYLAGGGKELRKHMFALFSSSALVVNVFEYWRKNNRIGDIAVACGAPAGMTDIAFEKPHKIGRLGTPYLDIEFNGEQKKPYAIEAKFTEPYQIITTLGKYLDNEKLWYGLDGCRDLAKEIVDKESIGAGYKYLDVSQLIKHILGLTYRYQTSGFTLLYLWYDWPGKDALRLKQEIRRFKSKIGNEVGFKDMTYQRLIDNINKIPNVDDNYLDYLRQRYFR